MCSWLLVARHNHAELYEEGPRRAKVLFQAIPDPAESTSDFARRVARLVGRFAEVRDFATLEIFASVRILAPLRMALDRRCASRLIAASNTLDLPGEVPPGLP